MDDAGFGSHVLCNAAAYLPVRLIHKPMLVLLTTDLHTCPTGATCLSADCFLDYAITRPSNILSQTQTTQYLDKVLTGSCGAIPDPYICFCFSTPCQANSSGLEPPSSCTTTFPFSKTRNVASLLKFDKIAHGFGVWNGGISHVFARTHVLVSIRESDLLDNFQLSSRRTTLNRRLQTTSTTSMAKKQKKQNQQGDHIPHRLQLACGH